MYPETRADVPAARAICRACTVRAPCLADAIANNEPAGMWAGLLTTERQQLVQAIKKDQPLFQVVSTIRSSRPRP